MRRTFSRKDAKLAKTSRRPLLFLKLAAAVIVALPVFSFSQSVLSQSPAAPPAFEYLWYEAENMRGITETSRHEALLNPSYLELPASRVPGWGINGPGVSTEWAQGGESEW